MSTVSNTTVSIAGHYVRVRRPLLFTALSRRRLLQGSWGLTLYRGNLAVVALHISVPPLEEKLAASIGVWHSSKPLQVSSRRSLGGRSFAGERWLEREDG